MTSLFAYDVQDQKIKHCSVKKKEPKVGSGELDIIEHLRTTYIVKQNKNRAITSQFIKLHTHIALH